MNVVKDVTFEGPSFSRSDAPLTIWKHRSANTHFWVSMDNSSPIATTQSTPYKRWWSTACATGPTTSRGRRFRSRCSTTASSSKRLATCQDWCAPITSATPISLATPRLPSISKPTNTSRSLARASIASATNWKQKAAPSCRSASTLSF